MALDLRGIALAIAVLTLAGGAGAGTPCDQSSSVLAAMNAARTAPAAFADAWPQGPRTDDIVEAIEFLSRQHPLPPLADSPRLAAAAARHAADQSWGALPGHIGLDGSTPGERIHRAGVFSMIIAEDISVGQTSGAAVVRQLIVDTGETGHMHRGDLFSPLLRFAGIGCGRDSTGRPFVVIDFSGTMMPR